MTKQYRSLIIASTVLILIAGLVLSGWMMKIFARLPLIAFDTMLQANNQVSEEQLKAKVISLEAEVASLLYLKSENELLKSAIDTKNETGIIPIQARIITFDNNFTRSSALVGVGSNLGVKEGQPVIYLGHLVGIVKEVSKDSSKIQFLNDADSKLAISLRNSNSSQGIFKSQFVTSLEVDYIFKL